VNINYSPLIQLYKQANIALAISLY